MAAYSTHADLTLARRWSTGSRCPTGSTASTPTPTAPWRTTSIIHPDYAEHDPAAVDRRRLRPAGAPAGAGGDVPQRRRWCTRRSARCTTRPGPPSPAGGTFKRTGRHRLRTRATAGSTTPRVTTGAPPAARTSSASTPTPWSTRRYLRNRGWAAERALAWHETGQADLVASSGATDGRTYSVDPAVAAQQDTYPGREEYAAQNLATAWLALYIGQIGVPRLDRGTLPVPASTTKAATAPKRTGDGAADPLTVAPATGVVVVRRDRPGRPAALGTAYGAARGGRPLGAPGRQGRGRRDGHGRAGPRGRARSSAASSWSSHWLDGRSRSATTHVLQRRRLQRRRGQSTTRRRPRRAALARRRTSSTTSTGSSPTDPSCRPCGPSS